MVATKRPAIENLKVHSDSVRVLYTLFFSPHHILKGHDNSLRHLSQACNGPFLGREKIYHTCVRVYVPHSLCKAVWVFYTPFKLIKKKKRLREKGSEPSTNNAMIFCAEMEQRDFQASVKITTSAQQTCTRPTEVTWLLLNNHTKLW